MENRNETNETGREVQDFEVDPKRRGTESNPANVEGITKDAGAGAGHVSDPVTHGGDDQTGVLSRIDASSATAAANTTAAGGDSDISGGRANLDANTGAPVEQNEYNR